MAEKKNGRPSNAQRAMQKLNMGEVERINRMLRLAAPRAVEMMLAFMDDETIDRKDRVRMAEKVFGMRLDALKAMMAVDRHNDPKVSSDASEPEQESAVSAGGVVVSFTRVNQDS